MSMKTKLGFNFFDMFLIVFCVGFALICFYPMWYIFIGSITPSTSIAFRPIGFLPPVNFTFKNYIDIIVGPIFLRSIGISVSKTLITTFGSIIITSMMAYGVSKKYVSGMSLINFLIVFTMFFGGGLIPTFLLIQGLGLYDTFWAMTVPFLTNIANFIIMRNYFAYSVPQELEDACVIDGANEVILFYKIVIPISMPMFAALFLFEAVRNWNDWYSYLIYVSRTELRPFIEVLRRLLISPGQFLDTYKSMADNVDSLPKTPAALKMTTIMVAMLPIMILYPFLQKHFAKGVLIGAVKE